VYEKYKKQIDVEAQGQMDLFLGGGKKRVHIQSPSPMPQVPLENKLSKYEKLQLEKELLGIYMSSHPLDQFEEFFRSKNVIPIENLENFKEGDIVIVGGNISAVKRITTKSGKPMAFAELEDKTGSVDIVVFPTDYLKVQSELKEEVPVLFAGKVNMRNGKVNIIANKAKALNPEKHAGKFDGVVFKIRPKHEEEEIAELKKIIKGNPGKRKVKIITYVGKEVNTIVLKNRVVINDEVKKMVLRFS
jgi:DNA polymerase-3 subunit alpha